MISLELVREIERRLQAGQAKSKIARAVHVGIPNVEAVGRGDHPRQLNPDWRPLRQPKRADTFGAPTREEIAAKCLEIQAGWTDNERDARRLGLRSFAA